MSVNVSLDDNLSRVQREILKLWPSNGHEIWLKCADVVKILNGSEKSTSVGFVLRTLYEKGYLEREYREPDSRIRSEARLIPFYKITPNGRKIK